MHLHPPVIITPRLMAGVKVGSGFISIGFSKRAGTDGRVRYEYFIDVGKKTSKGSDLQSGVGGGTLQAGLQSLLSFLTAAAESYSYHQRTGRKGENEDLFPKWVNEWAYQHSDELGMLSIEVEETAGLIRE